MTSILVFLLGLITGSILTTCIIRLPFPQSARANRAYCPNCNQKLPIKDLIPVISLLLCGRCRFCGGFLPKRYAVIEVLTGILFLWCFLLFGISVYSIKAIFLSAFLIVIVFIDIDHQLILDKVLLWLAITGIIINLFVISVSLLDMMIAFLTGGGLFLVIAIITKGGMGGGDIKFVAVLGLWLGFKLTLLTIFLSFLIGGLGSGLLLVARLKKRKDFIPFGPFIAIGAFLSLLYGEQLINWYFTIVLK